MIGNIQTVALIGFNGEVVQVESDAKKGLPAIQIVGMGNKAVDEAKERVRSAISNSLLEFPAKKLTINLAPAELPKDGAHFDLPIALSILTVSGQIKQNEVDDALFAGELALDGSVRPIKGAINIAETARRMKISTVYLPFANAAQAALVPDVEVIGIKTLKEVYLHLKREARLLPQIQDKLPPTVTCTGPILDNIHGQRLQRELSSLLLQGGTTFSSMDLREPVKQCSQKH